MGRRAKHVSSRRAALRLLGIPDKGQPHRKALVFGYGGLALSLATAATLGGASKAHDAKPPVALLSGDVYTSDPAEAERDTLLDGAGGIAGVPFTDEQRKAIVKESKRRGMSAGDAYALAYGDAARVEVHDDGTLTVDTSKVVLANGPVYRKAEATAPKGGNDAETLSAGTSRIAASEETAREVEQKAPAAPSAEDVQPVDLKEADEPAPAVTPQARGVAVEEAPLGEPYYPDSGTNPYDHGGSVVDAIKDALSPLTDFMESISRSGAREHVVESPDGGVTLITTSQITKGLEVAVQVASADPSDLASPVTVSAVASDPRTGEVLAETSPTTVDSTDEASHAAIGEVVEAVLTASDGGVQVVTPEWPSSVEELSGESPNLHLDLPVVAPLEPLDELAGHVELAEAA